MLTDIFLTEITQTRGLQITQQAAGYSRGLVIQNAFIGANTGCIRVGSSDGVAIRDCQISGQVGITTEDSPSNSSQNVFLENVVFDGNLQPNCNGLIIGGTGAMTGCDFASWDVAVRMYGKGFNISGNRTERNNTAYLLGLDSSTVATFQGTVSAGVLTVTSASGSPIAIGQMLYDGGVNVPPGTTIKSFGTGTGGNGTYNLIGGPSFSVGSAAAMTTIGANAGASGFAVTGGSTEGNWISFDLAGSCSAFSISSLTMLGHPSSNAGDDT